MAEPSGEKGEALTWISELADHPVSTAIARRPNGEIVIVEVLRPDPKSVGDMARALRSLDALEKLVHPHVARYRASWTSGEKILATSEYVEGETLRTLFALATNDPKGTNATRHLPLDVSARILADVLAGLSALHGLRNAKGVPLGFAHGEVCPQNAIVGTDGRARIVHITRPGADPAHPTRQAMPYVAPETLSDQKLSPRADVYGAGAILFEAISGSPPFDANRLAILAAHARGKLPRATLRPDDAWAEPLIAISARAMSTDPQKRYASASEMAAELRKATMTRMATPDRVIEVVDELAGAHILGRRGRLSP